MTDEEIEQELGRLFVELAKVQMLPSWRSRAVSQPRRWPTWRDYLAISLTRERMACSYRRRTARFR